MRVIQVTPCDISFMVTSIQNIQEIPKIRNSKSRVKGDTEDSTVQCSSLKRQISRKV